MDKPSFTITVHNCWDCPYRNTNDNGRVPHYCLKGHMSMSDKDYPKYCPFFKKVDDLISNDKKL